MMIPRVELADGTELSASAGYANGDLWIWFRDSQDDFLYLVTLFSNVDKTSKISYYDAGGIFQEWEGFTVLNTINRDFDGNISIRMRRE